MMKNKYLYIIILLCVFLVTCKKDYKPELFHVTKVDVTPSYISAEVNGTYSYSVVPQKMNLICGKKEDLTDALKYDLIIDGYDFAATIDNLDNGVKYYYCIECIASYSSVRSEIHSFMTLKITKPKVKTHDVDNVTLNSAKCGGEVISSCGSDVTSRGVCWNTTGSPTLSDNKTTDGSGTGSYTSNISNLSENTTYYVRAYATNEKGTAYGEEMIFTTLEEEETFCEPDGEINGYGYVDLALPSGLKWATCNVGASSPEEYGDYFAWGETDTKSEYTHENSETSGLDKSELEAYGYIDSEGNLTSLHDAATANWGDSWRMPTEAECQELIDNCTWTWMTQNGVNGYKVTGLNGSCIFLPAAGFRYGSSLNSDGNYGYYWSSTPFDDDYGDGACSLYFRGDYLYVYNYYLGRSYGRSVRPVIE